MQELRDQSLKRDELLLKLGAAKKEAGRAWHLVEIGLPKAREAVTAETFTFSLRRQRLRQARRREGRYLLRSNLTGEDPATLWRYYMQLCEIEQAFKELKHDLAIRPIFHQREDRIEAHIFGECQKQRADSISKFRFCNRSCVQSPNTLYMLSGRATRKPMLMSRYPEEPLPRAAERKPSGM